MSNVTKSEPQKYQQMLNKNVQNQYVSNKNNCISSDQM